MNIEEFRPYMDELYKSMANVENMLARNVDTFASITEDFVADIRIILRDMILPGHKYVLSSRCDVLAKLISTGVDELGMSLCKAHKWCLVITNKRFNSLY